jgi:hypothetical protein
MKTKIIASIFVGILSIGFFGGWYGMELAGFLAITEGLWERVGMLVFMVPAGIILFMLAGGLTYEFIREVIWDCKCECGEK